MPNFFVVMRLTEQFSRPLRRAANSANQMSDAANRMTAQMTAANGAFIGLGAGVSAFTGVMSVAAAQLEDNLARLATVTRGTMSTQADALANAEKAARDFSTQWTATAEEVVAAQFQIATAGVPVREQIAATQSAFKLARATMGEFTQSAQLLGSFLNTFGKSAEFNYLTPAQKMEGITDRLSTAVQRFQVTLPVLAESFKFIVGPASTLNLNLGEVTAALGVLNTAGFRGTLAGTALSNMFNKLDRAVDKLDLDPDKFIDLNGNLKDLTSFLGEVNRALADKTPIEQQNKLIEVFDIRAGRVIKTLLDNIDGLKKFSNEMEVSRGATQRMAKLVENTTSAAFKKLGNSVRNIATTIGEGLNEAFRPLAMVMRDIGVAVAGWVERNRGLATTIVLVTTTVAAASVGLFTLAFAAASASKAMASLGASSKLAALALLPFKAIGVVIGAVFSTAGAIVLAFAAAIGAVVVAAKFLAGDFDDTTSAVDRQIVSLEELNRSYGNSIERTSRFANELQRLGKTVKESIDLPLRSGEVLGNLPFAQQATNAVREDPTLSRAEALKTAAEAAGGFMGIVQQLSNELGQGTRANARYAETFTEMRAASDRTFEGLNDINKAAEFATAKLRGGETALKALSGGNQQAAESMASLLSIFDKLGARLDSTTRKGLQQEAFTAIAGNIDALRSSTSKGIQEIVRFFDQAKSLATAHDTDFEFAVEVFTQTGKEVRQLTADTLEFYQLIDRRGFDGLQTLRGEFNSLAFQAVFLNEAVRTMETSTKQVATSTKSVANLFKNASLGGESFARAQDLAAQRIADAEQSFQGIEKSVSFLKRAIDFVGDTPLANTEQFKKAQQFLEGLEDIEISLRTKIDEAQAAAEANRIFAIIDKQNKAFTSTQVKDLKRLGNAFAASIGEGLSGGLTGGAFASSIRDDFRRLFIGDLQKEIGLLFGNKFKDQFRNAINVAQQVIEQSELGGSLIQDLQGGDLARQINAAIQRAVPGIQGITGGDIFNLEGDNKLAEQFREVFTDASVSLATAGNRSAGFLRRLQDVVGKGPGQTENALRQQATQLRNLLSRASAVGARDAIGPIEDALKNALQALQTAGTPSAAEALEAATKRSTAALDTSTSRFSKAIAELSPAAGLFIRTIEEGFERIKNTELGAGAQQVIENFGNAARRVLKIDIETNGGDVNVDVSGGGAGPGLDEDEIRQIVDEARSELLSEVDEKLNKLESELRGR